tara:strand:+ start:632 stop:1051 length:420 start_codon:yes stop_codon:yes gene_type:complete
MGAFLSVNKINYLTMKNIVNNTNSIIINTLSKENQECLIKNTLSIDEEVNIINKYISKKGISKNIKNINIIIYGENCTDNKIINKYNQLKKLGFNNIYVYMGGLFEWLLLQDIYGDDEFPTTTTTIDILKYSGCQNKYF